MNFQPWILEPDNGSRGVRPNQIKLKIVVVKNSKFIMSKKVSSRYRIYIICESSIRGSGESTEMSFQDF